MPYTSLIKKLKQWFISSELITPEEYNDYIKNSEIEFIDDNNCVVVVNSTLAKSWLQNIDKEIGAGFKKIIGHPVCIDLILKKEFEDKKILETIKKDNGVFSKFSFENYISGESNKKAITAARGMIEAPGRKWNPLFIYGKSGLGKTHLLGAIYNSMIKKYPGILVRYITSFDFRKEVVESINESYKEIEKIKSDFAKLQVLLIDDIQFLANSNKTNEIFFSVFNTLIENNAQIVMTSDKIPEKLNGFENRLISRFAQGLRVKLDSLDIITKQKIISFKSTVANIKLTESAIKYIANSHINDVRWIEGVINTISFNFLNNKKEILDYDDIYEILKDDVYISGGELTAQKIKDIVANKYGVTTKHLESNSRIRTVSFPRHLSMYLIYKLLKMNQSEIGVIFGSRDHSSVTHAINKVEKALKTDKSLKGLVDKLKKQIIS